MAREPLDLEPGAAVPLCYVASSPRHPSANLGDALSALVVSALSGRAIQRVANASRKARMSAVGTIGQHLDGGRVTVWGTGFGSTPRTENRRAKTELDIRAVRGRLSRLYLEHEGYDVPKVFGDPVWLMPGLHRPPVEKRWELGIIPHISEIAGHDEDAALKANFVRYRVPDEFAGAVKIIPTYCGADVPSMLARIDEIRACKRILSTSFHGLLIAMAYGVPAAYFATASHGVTHLDAFDNSGDIDHRFRDWWLGMDRRRMPTYGVRRSHQTDWQAAMAAVDTLAEPVEWSGEALLDAFPLPVALDPFTFDGQDLLAAAPQLTKNDY